MSLRNPDNPKEFRTALHTFYEEYAHGTVNFPRIRLAGDPERVEDLPKKTRSIARTLIRTWDGIDAERDAHRGLVRFHKENPHELLLKGAGRGMVLGAAGRNALDMTLFTPIEDGFAIQHTLIGPRPVREGFLDTAEIQLGDGRIVDAGIFSGDLKPDVEVPLMIGDVLVRVTHFDGTPAQAA